MQLKLGVVISNQFFKRRKQHSVMHLRYIHNRFLNATIKLNDLSFAFDAFIRLRSAIQFLNVKIP